QRDRGAADECREHDRDIESAEIELPLRGDRRDREQRGRQARCGNAAAQTVHGRQRRGGRHRNYACMSLRRLQVSLRAPRAARTRRAACGGPPMAQTEPIAARAFWTAPPGRGEIRSEQLPAPAPGSVLVEALYSGISRGTESLIFAGRVPASEHARMRAPFQEGGFPGPVKYGYSRDRKSTRLNSSHVKISYAVFCL